MSKSYIGCAAQWAAAVVGVWLMAASDVLGYGGGSQTAERVAGPLVAAFGVVSAWEAARKIRFLNVPLAVALIGVTLYFGPAAARVNGVICGLVIVGLALVPYPPTHRFGGGWRGVVFPSRSTAGSA